MVARIERIGAERQKADLAGGASRAAQQAAPGNHPHADAGADRDDHEVVDSASDSLGEFAEGRDVHVVLQHHGMAELSGEVTGERCLVDAAQVGGDVGGAPAIRDTGPAHSGRTDRGRVDPGIPCQAQHLGRDLARAGRRPRPWGRSPRR